MKKEVLKHLKSDIKTFKKEAQEDRELMKKLKKGKAHKKARHAKKHKEHEKHESKKHEKAERMLKKSKRVVKKAKRRVKKDEKFERVMHEYGASELRSGSKHGPKVTNPKQAVAIAYSESRKAKRKKK